MLASYRLFVIVALTFIAVMVSLPPPGGSNNGLEINLFLQGNQIQEELNYNSGDIEVRNMKEQLNPVLRL